MSHPTGRRGALFTDFYELVMAQIYFDAGLADRPAQFDYSYRSNPDYGTHRAGYCVTVGLSAFIRWLDALAFDEEERDALAAMRDAAGRPVFSPTFLDWLAGDLREGIEVRAVPEGRVVHPHEPIMSVTGPLAVTQLVETALLNHLNYPTLVATKAARIVQSAQGGSVLEFGMRRGPGLGVPEGVRAALIGGCVATSDVQESVALGIAPRGTHAHSLVQVYMALGGGELEAFRHMAEMSPDGCVLLVDTIDTLGSGIPNAITVFDELRAAGHPPGGVRLDSGDLAHLAVRSARMLDEAGHRDVPIVLSGDLDELAIGEILSRIDAEAPVEGLDPGTLRRRLVYGVGTRLITSHGDPALNGVYKSVGVQDASGRWKPALKISESPAKVSVPGRKGLWRLYDDGGWAVADLVGDLGEDPLAEDVTTVHHPTRDGVSSELRSADIGGCEPLHDVVFDGGSRLDDVGLEELRRRCRADVDRLHGGVRRLVDPHPYPVSLTDGLHRRRRELIEAAGGSVRSDG